MYYYPYFFEIYKAYILQILNTLVWRILNMINLRLLFLFGQLREHYLGFTKLVELKHMMSIMQNQNLKT